MSGLDSIYAMLAQPVKAVLHPKRVVDQVSSATANAPDSHETPQSQLPPTLEGRDAKVRERRKDTDNSKNKKRRASDEPEELKEGVVLEVTDDTAEIKKPPSQHIIDVEV
ncbi:MAG: hypothetical protein KJ856_20045 [Gammaproteobacteria bacterium]|uniref:hypothetical protein n=1 Tax=Shewanella TaxID=22 RepID=UPI000CA1F8CA|nr:MULTISPECIES: hypothetical protein [Shewanella]EGT3628492.1 hypothetical protein [Morganella morganii]MBU1391600.1 hypothetical protein [Gammaproteobacteria bacterium]QYX65167.1 hypothetical protein K2227_02150 [Shewanella putrefaciens]AUD58097.1 hypothetical protein AYJ58_00725 [Shewanella sp. Pdp11]MBU1477649.1 hypothetical protein [Gammaproteobacteria bacterium]